MAVGERGTGSITREKMSAYVTLSYFEASWHNECFESFRLLLSSIGRVVQ